MIKLKYVPKHIPVLVGEQEGNYLNRDIEPDTRVVFMPILNTENEYRILTYYEFKSATFHVLATKEHRSVGLLLHKETKFFWMSPCVYPVDNEFCFEEVEDTIDEDELVAVNEFQPKEDLKVVWRMYQQYIEAVTKHNRMKSLLGKIDRETAIHILKIESVNKWWQDTITVTSITEEGKNEYMREFLNDIPYNDGYFHQQSSLWYLLTDYFKIEPEDVFGDLGEQAGEGITTLKTFTGRGTVDRYHKKNIDIKEVS